jgi:hypothetical protein
MTGRSRSRWRVNLGPSVFLAVTVVAAPNLPADSSGEPAHRPLIFQYTSPYMDGDTLMGGVMATSPEQMTVDEGRNPLFDGVTLIIPWSILEPADGQVDFDIIEAPLAYWAQQGKQVVLNVASMAFPTVMSRAWGGKLTGCTPDWVMQQCETHLVRTRILGPSREKAGPFPIPSPWDPHFKAAYFDLIAQLGRKYDGDARLAAVRIGTGMEGEEHPLYQKGKQYLLPGFTNRDWYGYVDATVEAYANAFPHSTLEADLGWITFAVEDEQGDGHAEAEHLFSLMHEHHVTFGCNGWSGADDAKLTESFDLMEHYRNQGDPVSLEVAAPAENPISWNTAAMLAVARRLRPARVNFMGDTAAIVDEAEGHPTSRDQLVLDHFPNAVRAKGGDPEQHARNYRDLIMNLRQIDLDNPTP